MLLQLTPTVDLLKKQFCLFVYPPTRFPMLFDMEKPKITTILIYNIRNFCLNGRQDIKTVTGSFKRVYALKGGGVRENRTKAYRGSSKSVRTLL